jgi:beta-lactamase superfamily II metal-dependent hydrolase
MEWYYGKVQITALAPSIGLRNRYATYGVDMNNASIVLRFEHHDEDILMKKSEEYAEREPPEVNRYDARAWLILHKHAHVNGTIFFLHARLVE